LFSQEGVDAFRRVRDSLEHLEDEHGVVDVFSKHRKIDIAASLLALGRLQTVAAIAAQDNGGNSTTSEASSASLSSSSSSSYSLSSCPLVDDADFIEDLAYYAVFADAAYGWKMDLVMRRRLSLRGDLHSVLRTTKIPEDDVVDCKWESRAHRPAYFIVRDRRKKSIVLCIRGTWSPHDFLTDMCFTADEYEIPSPDGRSHSHRHHGRRRRHRRRWGKRTIRAHHGMLEAARLVQQDVEDILIEEMEANPDYALVLVGHR